MKPKSPLLSRKFFPEFLNDHGLRDVAVEIGVCRGDFSRNFLERWKGRVYNMVDPYQHQGAKFDKSDAAQHVHDANHAVVELMIRANNLKKGRPLARLYRMFSEDAAAHAPIDSKGQSHPGRLDFVYLDARHDYRSVMADLEAWYPLVKTGGIIAGHDYKNSFVRKNLVEVKRAVDNFFCVRPEKTVQVTQDDNLPSWWVFKQDAPEPDDDDSSSSYGYGGWGHDE